MRLIAWRVAGVVGCVGVLVGPALVDRRATGPAAFGLLYGVLNERRLNWLAHQLRSRRPASPRLTGLFERARSYRTPRRPVNIMTVDPRPTGSPQLADKIVIAGETRRGHATIAVSPVAERELTDEELTSRLVVSIAWIDRRGVHAWTPVIHALTMAMSGMVLLLALLALTGAPALALPVAMAMPFVVAVRWVSARALDEATLADYRTAMASLPDPRPLLTAMERISRHNQGHVWSPSVPLGPLHRAWQLQDVFFGLPKHGDLARLATKLQVQKT